MPCVDIPEDSLFGLANLPYGVFSRPPGQSAPDVRPERRVGIAVGDFVLDIGPVARTAALTGATQLAEPTLNAFMAAGRDVWQAARTEITQLLSDESNRAIVEPNLYPREAVELHLPFDVADYVDFYSSEHHAANVGRMFRPDAEPLTPNWKHLPIGYHGRSGTVVVSGTPIRRPRGLWKAPELAAPDFGPSGRLDVEAEVGFVVGVPSELGASVAVADFEEHVFGVCLLNDWSARDIQSFEYVPLGPFLGKSFATSISPWIVPLAALDAARVAPPPRSPVPAAYLQDTLGRPCGFDLALEVEWNGTIVSRPPFAGMYWTPAQQLAHMTVNGASLRTGDLYASGTVSGPAAGERGSFLELSWNGRDRVSLDDGSDRAFLEDGDSVSIRATAPGTDGSRIGFGSVTGVILPAVDG